jgi:two-component system, sensor histidine kinase and response regulator
MCSERKISMVLSQWGLGYAVFSKKPVRNHLLERDFRIVRGTPIFRVLRAAMQRSEDFFDDVLLIDEQERFQGIISARTLMHLQHEINRQQYDQMLRLTDQLNINNEELAKARDIAFEAARLKASFLANMSHEIRTPMNGILGMVKILQRTALNGQQARYLNTIRNSGNSLLTILNDILDFSKIEAGRMDLESVPFDLADLMDECLQLLAERAHEKKLHLLGWTTAHAPTHLIGDPTRVRQVILNLLSNAVKFTEKGEVVATSELESETAQTATYRISVCDTGIGISDNDQKKLFQAFQQADSSTNRKFGGTGLGLTISRRLAELMGGEIGLQSRLGHGSTFWFRLTLPKASAPAAAEPLPAGMRVLALDEFRSMDRCYGELLGALGVESRVVHSREEAWTLLDHGTLPAFDAILADPRAHVMQGLEFLRQLRASPHGASLPLIAVTAAPEELQDELGPELSLDAVLHKPLRPAALRDVLLSLRTGGRTGRPGSALPTPAASPAPPVLPPRTGAEVAWDSPTPVKSLKLLLVEDSEVNREVALIQLAAWGHQVGVAENGRVALEKLRGEDFDGVLMDCQMPEMDGFEATQNLRLPGTGARNPHIYVIAMTANALQGDRERCLLAGMNDYVSKPVDDHELAAALSRCAAWNERGTRRAPMAGAPLTPPPPPPDAVFSATRSSVPNFPPRLIQLFLHETGQRLAEIEAAADAGDPARVSQIAHTIKGTAGNFRAQDLYQLAREVESLGQEGRITEVRDRLPGMRKAFETTTEQLQEALLTPAG